MIFDLAVLGIGALDKIPTGKGKRKASARFLRAEKNDLSSLLTTLDGAAKNGDAISGFGLLMLVERLKVTVSVMDTAADAILGDDDDTDSPGNNP